MHKDLEKLLLSERKNKRYLAELRSVRKKLVGDPSPDAVKKLKLIDEEIASMLK